MSEGIWTLVLSLMNFSQVASYPDLNGKWNRDYLEMSRPHNQSVTPSSTPAPTLVQSSISLSPPTIL